MYSMRSHKTGSYQLLLDSNMNIMLHKCYALPVGTEVSITVPRDCDQLDECIDIASHFKCSVEFLPIPYGTHAGETRDMLNTSVDKWIDQSEFDKVEIGVESVIPMIMNAEFILFNTSIPGAVRPYADKHLDSIVGILEAGYKVTFSCINQLYKIPMEYLHQCKVDTKFYSKEFMDYMAHKFTDQILFMELDRVIPRGSLFFPFRLSDPVYKFQHVIGRDIPVVITDPNESFSDGGNIINIGGMHSCKKTLYMTMLALMNSREDIVVPLYEDITTNYHISIVELFDRAYNQVEDFTGQPQREFIARYMS